MHRFFRNLVVAAVSLTVIFVWAFCMLGLPLILWLDYGLGRGWVMAIIAVTAIFGLAGFCTFFDSSAFRRVNRWVDGPQAPTLIPLKLATDEPNEQQSDVRKFRRRHLPD